MISVLKILVKTNIDGHIRYEPYTIKNVSNTVDISLDKLRIPQNTFLFSDLVPIEMKYFPNKRVDYLQNVLYSDMFVKVMSKKLDDYKKKNRKEFKISRVVAEEEEIPYFNIKNMVEFFFKSGSPFYYEKTRTLTVRNHYWNDGYNTTLMRVHNINYRVYEIHLDVDLDLRSPDKISEKELKKYACDAQYEKIKKNWYSLRGLRYVPPRGKVAELPRAPALYTSNISVGGKEKKVDDTEEKGVGGYSFHQTDSWYK